MENIHVHIFVPNKDYCNVEGVAECERIRSAIDGASYNKVMLFYTYYNEGNPNHLKLNLPRLPYMVVYDPDKEKALNLSDPAELNIEEIRQRVAYYSMAVQYNEQTGSYYDSLGEVEPLMSIQLGKSQKGLGGLGLSQLPLFNWPDCEKYLPEVVCNQKQLLGWLLLIVIFLLVLKILK